MRAYEKELFAYRCDELAGTIDKVAADRAAKDNPGVLEKLESLRVLLTELGNIWRQTPRTESPS